MGVAQGKPSAEPGEFGLNRGRTCEGRGYAVRSKYEKLPWI